MKQHKHNVLQLSDDKYLGKALNSRRLFSSPTLFRLGNHAVSLSPEKVLLTLQTALAYETLKSSAVRALFD